MKSRLWGLVALVLVAGLIAGCGERVTAEEIVERVRETVDSTRDAHAVVVADAQVQGMALAVTAEVWEQMPNRFRVQVLEASQPELVGTTMVTDGQQAWLYEPTENRVMVGAAGELDMPLPQEVLGHLQEAIQGVLDASTVELSGEETVAGHDTYRLVLTPKEGAEAQPALLSSGTTTLWVDQEEWFVLKVLFESEALGRGSLEVQSFELNPGLPDDLFTFEIPEGAEVVDVKANAPVHLSLEQARAQAGFPLLVPAYVPAGATLIDVYLVSGTVVMDYNHASEASFTILQASPAPEVEDTREVPGVERQEVTVHGQPAWLVTQPQMDRRFVTWTENGVYINIGGQIGEEELLKVAESLE
ncbi:MAG TPA: DUF4367 domain-containing protein [Anaerolineae bacterium]|nr:DUF4367 domain-containing protein [Anaerolineae bacterium]